MKILVLSPQNPYPAVDGGKMSILGPALELGSLGHQTGLFFLHNDRAKAAQSSGFFTSRGVRAYPFLLDTSDRLMKVVTNVGRQAPFKMAKYFSSGAMAYLADVVREFDPDVVQTQHAHMGGYALGLRRRFGIPIVLREHNIEYRLTEQFYRSTGNPVLRVLAWWQYLKTKRYETGLWSRFDRVVFISRPDAKLAESDVPGIRAEAVEDGVDAATFTRKNSVGKPRSAIFAGSLGTLQNLHSIVWFITRVWPAVRRSEPQAKLYLTGGAESILLRELKTDMNGLNREGVFPLGFVEDIGGAITDCEVFVSPTQMGSGIRIKVLTAMALGMPIVCTTLDSQSIPGASHNEHLYVADEPEEFARGMLTLFRDGELRQVLGRNARRLVERQLTWARCARGLVKVYEEILADEGAAA